MIDVVDSELVEWLAGVVAPEPVTLGPPTGPSDEPNGVTCHLLALLPTPTSRGNRRPPVHAVARYLVTSSAPEPIVAHRLLGQVLVAVTDRSDLEVEWTEPPVALWQALGVTPQPALVVRAPVRWDRPDPRAPLVREPLHIEWERSRRLAGAVVSPGGTPVARAEVRVPGVDAPVWTERDGTFLVPGLPATTGAVTLTVSARGLVRTVPVTVPADPATPLTVVFDPEE